MEQELITHFKILSNFTDSALAMACAVYTVNTISGWVRSNYMAAHRRTIGKYKVSKATKRNMEIVKEQDRKDLEKISWG